MNEIKEEEKEIKHKKALLPLPKIDPPKPKLKIIKERDLSEEDEYMKTEGWSLENDSNVYLTPRKNKNKLKEKLNIEENKKINVKVKEK